MGRCPGQLELWHPAPASQPEGGHCVKGTGWGDSRDALTVRASCLSLLTSKELDWVMSEGQDVEEDVKGGCTLRPPASAGGQVGKAGCSSRVATLLWQWSLLLLHGNELTKIQLQWITPVGAWAIPAASEAAAWQWIDQKTAPANCQSMRARAAFTCSQKRAASKS